MKQIALFFILALVILMVGCSDEPSSPIKATNTSPEVTLADLGWPDNMPAEEIRPSYSDSKWVPTDSLWKYDVLMVTIVWGNPLPATTPNIAPLIDWTGDMWINGVVKLDPRMLISFEQGQDTLILSDSFPPVRWISFTKGDFDGLTMAMYVDKTVMYVMEPELHFETAQGSLKWSLSSLYKFDSLYFFDNTRIVAIHSRKVELPCLQGLMSGTWIKEDASHGSYAGIWGGPYANLQGQLRGRFWTTDDGKRLLDGEWINPVNNAKGVIKGKWEYYDPTMCPMCGEGHGYFAGTVTFPSSNDLMPIRIVGEFGQFGAITDTLPFRGRWQVLCNNSSVGILDR